MNQIYFLGVDLSKEKIDCCLINGKNQVQLAKVVGNKGTSITKFLCFILKKFQIEKENLLVCCEETGLYTHPLKGVCSELDIPLWVEPALKIKRATVDMRGKSDAKDAGRIAEYAFRYQDKKRLYVQPEKTIRNIQQLLSAREAILSQQVRLEQELKETKSFDKEKYKVLKAAFTAPIAVLKKKKKEIEVQIVELIKAHPEIAQNVDLLKSIHGVGHQVALEIILATKNFTQFETPQQMSCYAGVAPFPNESGTMVKKHRVSNLANKKLKKLLHLAAMAAIRSKGDLREYYIRKVKEGKNKMLILNAVRNKIVHRMFAVIKRRTPYVPFLTIPSIKEENLVAC